MNETETKRELITPKLVRKGWDSRENGTLIKMEFPVYPGPIMTGNRRPNPKKADYVLFHKNKKIAVVEAKAVGKSAREGISQAREYARKLQVRYTYATNGKTIYEIDMEKDWEQVEVKEFPTPQELSERTRKEPGSQDEEVWKERFDSIPFDTRNGTWEPRYYQENAILKSLYAIAEGKRRILLTLATGTGKTAIAFQIAWKLFNTRWNLKRDGRRLPRILFLADRNILADQAVNSFSSFDDNALVRIRPEEIRKRGHVPKNGSVFFTIFQTFMSGNGEKAHFGEYPEDYFDLVIIDECHRGGANDESAWREILEHFSPAIQIGLTATPRKRENTDTYKYFGDPVYEYSLKDGINEGFLTPFRVREIKTTIDTYRFNDDDLVLEGDVDREKTYTQEEMNRSIEIQERERYLVSKFLEMMGKDEKTIVFCTTQRHALLVRDIINQIKENTEYCQRVTADEGNEGEQYLRNFQDNEKRIPTVLTTSRKLSTGVDAPELKNIVIMRSIKSIVEFKQIVGRGTRVFEGKSHFTIYDFAKACEMFADPGWDGPPICEKCNSNPCTCKQEACEKCGYVPCRCQKERCKKCNSNPCTCKQETCEKCGYVPCRCENPKTPIRIRLSDGTYRKISSTVKTLFWDIEGKPINAEEFLKKVFGAIPGFFKNEEDLRKIWSKPETRRKLIERMDEDGFSIRDFNIIKKLINAEKSDVYDILLWIAYRKDPLDRAERGGYAKSKIKANGDKEREFIEFVINEYVKHGINQLQLKELEYLIRNKYGELEDAKKELQKSSSAIRKSFSDFQKHLYEKTF